MIKKKVWVVLGGTSGERKVSLETGKACLKALKNMGYKTSTYDPKKKPLNLIDKNKVDIIFNALHGKDGEDGVAQSYFEYLKIPYIADAGEISIFCGAIFGSCLGFLWYNAPPAKIFMGDTGSLSLGGSLFDIGGE